MRSAAIGLFAYHLAGCDVLMSPKDARAKGADFNILSQSEVSALEALGEGLVPGATAAGLSHYIDANLSRDGAESLLMVRYFDLTVSQGSFYKAGLAALDSHSRKQAGKAFADLGEAEAIPIIESLLKGNPPEWDLVAKAPPSVIFYLAVRGDAVDIVYGTMAGFEALDVPYVGHIDPKSSY